MAVAANAPAFAASTDAPSPGSVTVACRTNGQGGGNCQGYRLILNFNVQGVTSWNIRVTIAQITSSAGATISINEPVEFPYVVSPTSPSMNLWYCSASSPSGLTLDVSYSAWQVGQPESTAVVQSFAQTVYPGSSIAVC